MSYEIETYCINVKSLVWGQKGYKEPTDRPAFLKWINSLKLESLTLLDDTPLKTKLFHGITSLTELKMDCHFSDESLVIELYKILEQNVNIENLHIQLTNNFNFEIFGKLKNLRHLGIGVTQPEDIIKIIPFLKMHGVTKLQIAVLFEQFDESEEMPDGFEEMPDDFEEMPMELNESLKRLAKIVPLKELSLKPLDEDDDFADFYTSTIRTLDLFELTSLHLQGYLDYDRRYEIIANAQPNLTNLDLHFWNSGNNMQFDATVFLIKNLKRLETFRVHLWPTAVEKFLDENVFIGILQESTERPTLTVKFHDYHQVENVAVKFFFKECMHKVIRLKSKETFSCFEYEIYRPWCVDDLEALKCGFPHS